jgi:hypothetical protein
MKSFRFFAAVVMMMTGLSVSAGDLDNSASTSSFSAEDQQVFNKASKDFDYEEYQAALPSFLALLDKNPEDLNLNFHVGMCYFYMKDEVKAATYLDKAATDRSLKIRIMFLKNLTQKNSTAF